MIDLSHAQAPSHVWLMCEGKQTATEFGFPDLEKQAQKPLVAAAHVSSVKNWVVETLSRLYGASQVRTSYGYETKYKRIQVLKLPKTHAHDAIAIACRVGEGVIPNQASSSVRYAPANSGGCVAPQHGWLFIQERIVLPLSGQDGSLRTQ